MRLFRFAGFELDEQRAELRGPGGPIRLRPKTFDMLRLLAASAGRVVSKQELMEAVWPNVHVSEDSLFQCVRELRTALGDNDRQVIKVVPGRGYLFEAGVSSEPAGAPSAAPPPTAVPESGASPAGMPRPLPNSWPRWALGGLAALAVLVGLTVAAPALLSRPGPVTVAVASIVDASGDAAGDSMARAVTDQLADGLAAIDNIRVIAPGSAGSGAGSTYAIDGQLGKEQQSWTLNVRMVERATGEVRSVATISVDSASLAPQLQQSRLAAGVGDVLARRLNALLEDGASGRAAVATTSGKVAIEQASASINQTSRERFAAAQAMLEDALRVEPTNTDLQVALAGLQMRGIQMVWYGPAERDAAEAEARDLLQHAIATRPRSIAVLEAQCRFLSATNAFVESLVACGQALSFDPWDGSALYLVGLGQVYLGRFEDALATFETADRYDTPSVSRWTWLLGAGWANLLLGRNAEAVPWLQRSIAVTSASGRSQMDLAVAYQRLGRSEEARAAMAEGMRLRPGSTAVNVMPPTGNASPAFVAAAMDIVRTMVQLGLPDH